MTTIRLPASACLPVPKPPPVHRPETPPLGALLLLRAPCCLLSPSPPNAMQPKPSISPAQGTTAFCTYLGSLPLTRLPGLTSPVTLPICSEAPQPSFHPYSTRHLACGRPNRCLLCMADRSSRRPPRTTSATLRQMHVCSILSRTYTSPPLPVSLSIVNSRRDDDLCPAVQQLTWGPLLM